MAFISAKTPGNKTSTITGKSILLPEAVTTQDWNRARDTGDCAISVTAGESATAQGAIMAPLVLTATETMAAQVKPRLAADPSRLRDGQFGAEPKWWQREEEGRLLEGSRSEGLSYGQERLGFSYGLAVYITVRHDTGGGVTKGDG